MSNKIVRYPSAKSGVTERRIPRRLLGSTVTGPIFAFQTVALIAPPRVAFEMFAELGVRAVEPEAKVLGTVASRHAGADAFFANLAFTGLAAGSLFAAPIAVQRALFEELTAYLLARGDATGLESFYLTAWQTLWTDFEAEEQRRAAEIWNEMIRYGRLAQTFGVVGIDRQTDTAVGFGPEQIRLAGNLRPLQDEPWYGGNGSAGSGRGFPGGSSGIPGDPTGFGSDHGGTSGGQSGLPGGPSGLGSGRDGGTPGARSGMPGGPTGLGRGHGGAPGNPSGLPGGPSGLGSGRDITGGRRGSSGGILGQDPRGPLGAIINDIEARMDKLGDAQRDAASAGSKQALGTAMMGFGAVVAGVGGGLLKDPFLAGVGIGIAYVGAVAHASGAAAKAEAEKTIATEQEKQREAEAKKAAPPPPPPDKYPNPFDYVAHVASLELQASDFYANGDGQPGGGTRAAVGIREVAAEVVAGAGLAAFFVTNEKGHVRLPGAMSGTNLFGLQARTPAMR